MRIRDRVVFLLWAIFAPLLGASAQASCIDVGVTLTERDDGVEIAYKFPREIAEFGFSWDRFTARVDNWLVQDRDVILLPDRARFAKPRSAISFFTKVDAKRLDRVYPFATKGPGYWLIFDPHVAVKSARTHVSYATPSGDIASHVLADAACADGKALPATYSGFTKIKSVVLGLRAGPPDWADKLAKQEFAAAYGFFAKIFGTSAPHSDLIVSLSPTDGHPAVSGDATDRGQIVVSLPGDGWTSASPARRLDLMGVVWHETGHLWHVGKDVDLDERIAEGNAEYLSTLGLWRTGRISIGEFEAKISLLAGNCFKRVYGQAITDIAAIRTGLDVYSCGFLLNWLADGATWPGPKSGDRLAIVSRSFFSKPPLSADRFRRLVRRDALAASLFDAFLSGVATKNWQGFLKSLRQAGTDATLIDGSTDGPKLLLYALAQFVYKICKEGEGYGAYLDDSGATLHVGPACGPISRPLTVRRIDGIDLIEKPLAAARRLFEACAAGAVVALENPADKSTTTIRCPGPLPPMPLELEISRS